jgi:hypothetical protein
MASVTYATLTSEVVVLLADQTGRPVGDHKAPGGTNTTADPPYLIVRRANVGAHQGQLGAPGEIAVVTFEVTSVGLRRDQAEALADLAQTVWLDPVTYPLIVAGLTVMRRALGDCPPIDTEGPVVNDLRSYQATVSVL